MLLASNNGSGADITTEYEVLSYTSVNHLAAKVSGRIGLFNVVGFGDYFCRFYINGSLVVPDVGVTIPALTSAYLQSRTILLNQGEVLSVRILGQPADNSVNFDVYLVDETPLTADQIAGIADLIEADLVKTIEKALETICIQVSPGTVVRGPFSRSTDVVRQPVPDVVGPQPGVALLGPLARGVATARQPLPDTVGPGPGKLRGPLKRGQTNIQQPPSDVVP